MYVVGLGEVDEDGLEKSVGCFVKAIDGAL